MNTTERKQKIESLTAGLHDIADRIALIKVQLIKALSVLPNADPCWRDGAYRAIEGLEREAADHKSNLEMNVRILNREANGYDAVKHAVQTAYKALRKKGFLCYSNLEDCQSCAGAILEEKFDAKGTPHDQRNYVYWHAQDDAHARKNCHRDGGGLYLAWGNSKTDGIGFIIEGELEKAGCIVEWDGKGSSRIKVTGTHVD